jgi:hypothetical protein
MRNNVFGRDSSLCSDLMLRRGELPYWILYAVGVTKANTTIQEKGDHPMRKEDSKLDFTGQDIYVEFRHELGHARSSRIFTLICGEK